MGHDHSKPLLLPPLSFKDCFVDGEVDISRYLYYRRKRDEIDGANTKHLERFVSKKRRFMDLLRLLPLHQILLPIFADLLRSKDFLLEIMMVL